MATKMGSGSALIGTPPYPGTQQYRSIALIEPGSTFEFDTSALHRRSSPPALQAPFKIDGDRRSHFDAAQFLRRCKPRPNDLAIVKLQLGQTVQSQFKEVHPVSPPVAYLCGFTGGQQPQRNKTDLLGQLTPRRCVGRLAALDTAARESPLDLI